MAFNQGEDHEEDGDEEIGENVRSTPLTLTIRLGFSY